jgi:hypothetical protein
MFSSAPLAFLRAAPVKQLYGSVPQVLRVGAVDRHLLLDLGPRAGGAEHAQLGIALLPDVRILAMKAVRYDQDCRFAPTLDLRHLGVGECDGVVHQDALSVQFHEPHDPPRAALRQRAVDAPDLVRELLYRPMLEHRPGPETLCHRRVLPVQSPSTDAVMVPARGCSKWGGGKLSRHAEWARS